METECTPVKFVKSATSDVYSWKMRSICTELYFYASASAITKINEDASKINETHLFVCSVFYRIVENLISKSYAGIINMLSIYVI